MAKKKLKKVKGGNERFHKKNFSMLVGSHNETIGLFEKVPPGYDKSTDIIPPIGQPRKSNIHELLFEKMVKNHHYFAS